MNFLLVIWFFGPVCPDRRKVMLMNPPCMGTGQKGPGLFKLVAYHLHGTCASHCLGYVKLYHIHPFSPSCKLQFDICLTTRYNLSTIQIRCASSTWELLSESLPNAVDIWPNILPRRPSPYTPLLHTSNCFKFWDLKIMCGDGIPTAIMLGP